MYIVITVNAYDDLLATEKRLRTIMNYSITYEAARVNAGLTQKEAAERLNITAQTLKRWESYKSFPTVDHFIDLCNLYGCPINSIKVSA